MKVNVPDKPLESESLFGADYLDRFKVLGNIVWNPFLQYTKNIHFFLKSFYLFILPQTELESSSLPMPHGNAICVLNHLGHLQNVDFIHTVLEHIA